MPLAMRDIWADHVRALSVDPRDADSFVMAAGDRFAKPAGVYVSRDGGKTFRRTLEARFYGDGSRRWTGQCMARHPSNPDILYCGEDWDGIFRSDDNGETWRSLGLTKTFITDIRIDPNNPQRVYVCAPKMPLGRQIRPEDPKTREIGFFRSDDGGETWQKISDESPSETAQIVGSQRIVGLFNDRHVRVSDDCGETWTPFEDGLFISPDDAKLEYVDDGRYQALAAGPDFWLIGNMRGAVFRRPGGTGVPPVPNENGHDAHSPDTWQPVERKSATLGDPIAEHHHAKRAAQGEFWSLSTLIIDPREALFFVLFIIVLQWMDGNVLGPKILGETVGISGFWIMVSVIVGGGLFHIPGMLLGVPVFAAIYVLVSEGVNDRLKKRKTKSKLSAKAAQPATAAAQPVSENTKSSDQEAL